MTTQQHELGPELIEDEPRGVYDWSAEGDFAGTVTQTPDARREVYAAASWWNDPLRWDPPKGRHVA